MYGVESLPPTVATDGNSLQNYREVYVAAAGSKTYKKWRCPTKDCDYTHTTPVASFGVSHFCLKKRQHVELKGEG